jgi:hypothetical protein
MNNPGYHRIGATDYPNDPHEPTFATDDGIVFYPKCNYYPNTNTGVYRDRSSYFQLVGNRNGLYSVVDYREPGAFIKHGLTETEALAHIDRANAKHEAKVTV